MKPNLRNFNGEADYWRIRQFLRQLMQLNRLHEYSWSVMRLDYWYIFGMNNIHPCDDMGKIIFIWENQAGEIAAVLNPEEPGDVFIQIHPEYKTKALELEMIQKAEESLYVVKDGGKRIHLWADSKDTPRQEILKSRGYSRTGWVDNQWRHDLSGPIPDVPTIDGYTLRALGDGNELPARGWASWRGFHPTEPEEKYGGWEFYHDIQRCPLYRRDLDLVAVTQDLIAAFATFWFDDVTRTVYIEPVATVPEHQRRGLARALILEGLQRVKKLGAVRAFVGGYEPGPDALYSQVLSAEHDVAEQWSKTWQ